jgi:DNA-binding HxlR family transcriptional regulator
VARSLDAIGERWALLVVRELLLGPKRFAELRNGLPGVSPNVLTQRIRDLVDKGVVYRQQLGPPANVQVYGLTEQGQQLEPVLLFLGRWGTQMAMPADAPLGVDSILLGVKAWFAANRRTTRYRITIGSTHYVLSASAEDVAMQRVAADDGDPDTEIVISDAAALESLATGRRTLEDVVAAGNLRYVGPKKTFDDFVAALMPDTSSDSFRSGGRSS